VNAKALTRVGLSIGIPAALLAGSWVVARAAELKVWSSGEVLTAGDLNANMDELAARIAALAAAAESADRPCPRGYAQPPAAGSIVLCTRGADEVVKVGNGASAFWIDRYEASVWTEPDGSGTQHGTAAGSYPSTFPESGQVTDAAHLLFAASKAGVLPSRYLTWFQANLACRASGKRLPSDVEWQTAATGTIDPGSSTGDAGNCATNATGPRNTGSGTACSSLWGAQDMIGNVWEFTAHWYAGLGAATANDNRYPWPANYSSDGEDGTFNVISSAVHGTGGERREGLPASATRGGSWATGISGGVFAIDLSNGPSKSDEVIGFRCVVTG
jgi:hypothetical protein